MNETRDTLVQFARDTRHKDHELETAEDVRVLCKKLLATQAPIVPQDQWSNVYRYVQDDLERLTFRSDSGHTPTDYARHKELPLAFYTQVLAHAEPSTVVKQGDATYNDFVARVVPDALQDDGLLLFFLHGARHKNLREMLETHYPDAATHKTLYQRMMDYNVHDHEDPRQVERDVGFMIVNLPLDTLDDVYLYETPEERETEQDTQDRDAPKKLENRPVQLEQVHDTAEWTSDHETALRNNPVMIQYRKQTGLAAHFPSRKALKQYLVMAVAPTQVGQLAHDTLGKRQTHDRLPNALVPTQNHHEWMGALGVLQSVPADQVNALALHDPQAHYFYNVLASAMPRADLEALDTREFLELWITAHSGKHWAERWSDTAPTGTLKRAVRKYLARYPQAPESLVQFLCDIPQSK